MLKHLFMILILLMTVACKANEPVIVKKESTDNPIVSEPELIEEESKQNEDQLIEFSLPFEQVVINLKRVPILNEYLRFINDQEKVVQEMDLIPIDLKEHTIYLLEFSCQNNLCSYLILDQSKDNPTYLVADLAKYVDSLLSPDGSTIILKFNRKTSLSLPLTNLVAIDLEQWDILSLKTQSGEKEYLNFTWPLSSISWIDENTISAHRLIISVLTEESISKWKNSGSQTTNIIFHVEK